MAKKNIPPIVLLALLALGVGLLVYGISTLVQVQGLVAHRVASALAERTSTQTAGIVCTVVGALLLVAAVLLLLQSKVPFSAQQLLVWAVTLVGFGLLGHGLATFGAQGWSMVSQLGRAAGRQSSRDRLALVFTIVGAVLGAGGLLLSLAASSRGSGRKRR